MLATENSIHRLALDRPLNGSLACAPPDSETVSGLLARAKLHCSKQPSFIVKKSPWTFAAAPAVQEN